MKTTETKQECTCGRWYDNAKGVSACQQHGHHTPKWSPEGEYQPIATVEQEMTVNCTECGERLHFSMSQTKDGVVIDIPPHFCQIDAPEAQEVAL